MSADGWHEAEPADVAEAVHYALRFDPTGKPHGKRKQGDARRLAEHVVAHLQRANYRIQHGPPALRHSTSELSRKPGGMPDGRHG
jgi:predicted GNAT family acetyltransferase